MRFEVEPELPPIRRKSKVEDEFAELLDVLQTGKAVSLPNLGSKRDAQQLAMRVRYFASKRGFGVTQRYVADEAKLYLQRND